MVYISQFSLFSYHETFLKAEEECNKVGGYLADVLDNDENNWIKSVLNVINPKDGTDYWLGGANNGWDGDGTWMGVHPSMYWVSSLYSWLTGNLFNYSVFSSQKLKSRSSIVSLHCTILTPNMPLIQLWCAQSKLNMDEICSLNIHL